MLNLINTLSDPVYSFTAVCVLFVIAMKNIEKIATKKFGIAMFTSIAIVITASFFNDNFRTNFMMTTDNIPIIYLIFLVAGTAWFSLYKGIKNDKRMEKGLPPIEGTPENREKVWAWPNLVYIELFCTIAFITFWVVWAIFAKSPLEEPANPTWAPNPAKAPWYFLGLQEILVYFDPWIAGVVLPVLILVGLILIPYIDVNPKGNGYYTFRERKFAITTWMFGWLVLWIFLIIVGTIFRGPNWTFYGPYEAWDTHKLVAQSNINLSEIFWVKILGKALPTGIILREIVGVIAVGLYFILGFPLITKFWGYKYLKRMGSVRYYLMVFLILMMASLPIKMYLRWAVNLKYIVTMPEFEFNI